MSLPEVVSCRLDRVFNRFGNMSVSFSFTSVTFIGLFICMILTTLSNVSYGRCKVMRNGNINQLYRRRKFSHQYTYNLYVEYYLQFVGCKRADSLQVSCSTRQIYVELFLSNNF
jgi:hypothetical protein